MAGLVVALQDLVVLVAVGVAVEEAVEVAASVKVGNEQMLLQSPNLN